MFVCAGDPISMVRYALSPVSNLLRKAFAAPAHIDPGSAPSRADSVVQSFGDHLAAGFALPVSRFDDQGKNASRESSWGDADDYISRLVVRTDVMHLSACNTRPP